MGSKLSPVAEVAFALDAGQRNCHFPALSSSVVNIRLTKAADIWPIKLTNYRCLLSLFLSSFLSFSVLHLAQLCEHCSLKSNSVAWKWNIMVVVSHSVQILRRQYC